MKKTMFKRALCSALILAAAAFASCTDEKLDEGGVVPETPESAQSDLTTVKLATFSGDASRVTYATGETRADDAPGTLKLVASIANPSGNEGFNFTPEAGGRNLSATSVYYNETDGTYYVTYHMQGNNYNTTLETDTAGAIQTFTVSDTGVVTLGNGFRAAAPEEEDFDFNHIYFDNTDQRIIAVGHNVKDGNRKNTNAIVGLFNPETGTLNYTTVKTSEKDYDDAGKSLGYKDAGDVNWIMRPNDLFDFNGYSGWNFYLVATRKGLAAVSAFEENLFKPVLTEDGTNYFIPTPGSAKSIQQGTAGSYVNMLYLSEDTSEKPEAYGTSSEAKIAHFLVQTGNNNSLRSLYSRETQNFTPATHTIGQLGGQSTLPAAISPVDGKNVLCYPPKNSDEEYYAALGANGLYYHFPGTKKPMHEGIIRFSNRPVNCVFVDRSMNESGHDGFIYVANGSKLTILHRNTLQEIVSWNMPSTDDDGNDIASSANYITVRTAPRVGDSWDARPRYITVAFGQAGVKIFKFTPTTGKTVWELDDYPTDIQ